MIGPKIVRSALFATLLFVSAALAGCVSEDGTESPEDKTSEPNLTEIDLSYANLSGANLDYADLTNADLRNADLTDAGLEYADLTNADLSYADLRRANLHGANLNGANLTGANLTGAATLHYTDFTDAIVTDADFTDTYWYYTVWTDGETYDENPTITEEESGPIYIPPCNTTASEGMNPTSNPLDWPEIQTGQWISVEGLTDVSYASIEYSNDSGIIIDNRLDWMCGYTYSVKVPRGYNSSNEYPVFLFLHGQLLDSVFFNNMLTNNFYMPEDDKYIIVRPSKLESDWDPKKALDVLEDVKSHLSVDDDRVYLTGLSMGGRGTFIVAAALPDYFAAIMPLSPHHGPYSYLPLAEDVAHLPIWMSHGTADNTSSYEMAAQMAENLTELGAEIEFETVVDGEHGGWYTIYTDPVAMQWILSHVRGQ